MDSALLAAVVHESYDSVDVDPATVSTNAVLIRQHPSNGDDDESNDYEDKPNRGTEAGLVVRPNAAGDYRQERPSSVSALLWTSLRRMSWRLYLSLLLRAMIPTVYKTTRVFYLGDLPDDHGVNIASQLAWVVQARTVIYSALITPLFYTIGATLGDKKETANRLKTGILFTVLVYTVFSGVIVAAARPLVRLMSQDERLIEHTVTYIRLEMITNPLTALVYFVTVVFILLKWRAHIYAVIMLKMTLSVILDTFFLSELNCSLKLGVNGIAYTNIITDTLTSIYCLVVLAVKYGGACRSSGMSFAWMRTWGSVGVYSGLDSLIRNLFYTLCVLRMMNMISQQGAYFRAHGFLVNWLLPPLYPLEEILKQDTGDATNPPLDHKLKTAGYLATVVVMGLTWCASVPLWKPFLETVLNIPADRVDTVYIIALVLMPAHVVLMINTLMAGVLLGMGWTVIFAIQSAITNPLVYGTSFVLFLCGVYEPNVYSISILFSISIVVDNVVTTGFYAWFLRKVNYRI